MEDSDRRSAEPQAPRRRRAREVLADLKAQARPKSIRLSRVLRRLGEREGDRIPVRVLLDTFQDRAFGAMMFVFAAPNIIPLPPGSSSVLGAPLILVAAQLAIGRRLLWLPKRVRQQSIRKADYLRMLDLGLPHLRRAERLLAPRFEFMFGPFGDRLIGIVCLLLSIILFLPIPFGNMMPGLAITCFSLALLQRDGLAALAGWIASVLSVLILALVSGAIVIAVTAFFAALRDTF